MTFVFPIILGGLAVAGIPILLHLIMRQKPKVLPFPAFRFLVQRSKTNLRKLRLRHLLLLALRMLIIIAICLAIARPKVISSALNLATDRPVAAVFLFDTSYSMTYMNSEKQTRLQEAIKRGLELLNELPEGSKIAVLDTAEAASSREWLSSFTEARERIKGLKPRPANGPVTARLRDAFRLFAALARTPDEESAKAKELPRFLCVFSDRTRASWEQGALTEVYDSADEVPPTIAGLHKLRDDAPALVDMLKDLRQKLPPPAGQDYPEQALIDGIGVLRDRIGGLTSEDLPVDRELKKQLADVRRPARQLLAAVRKQEPPAAQKEYREKLSAGLKSVLTSLRGLHAVFIDVGVEKPTDLAILNVQFPLSPHGQPHQVFPRNRELILKVPVQATGKNYNTNLLCTIGKLSYNLPIVVKAGERYTAEFPAIDLSKLPEGPNQVKLELKPHDLLEFNDQHYATFAIRKPRHVLIVADDPAKAEMFQMALEANRYAPRTEATRDVLKAGKLPDAEAVYLFDVAQPTDELWRLLDEFVKKGGGLGIIPGGEEVKPAAYNSKAAEKLMPAKLKDVVVLGDLLEKKDENKVAIWDLGQDSIYQHPLLRPFRDWRDNLNIDIIRSPRRVARFWAVEAYSGKCAPLVSYTDAQKRPALLERLFDKDKRRLGHVLLFTTTFDDRQKPQWNNYVTFETAFYVIIADFATTYLAGDTEEPKLNFQSGQAPPVVRLPVNRNFRTYSLQGRNMLKDVAIAEEQNDVVLKEASAPGNYLLDASKGNEQNGQVIAAFSVNVPPQESDLTRVPPPEIDPVLGPDAIVPVDRRAKIRDALQGHWNEPIELFPFLMVLLLVVLALENLLANKFYKREEE